jgi:hypothetical protein
MNRPTVQETGWTIVWLDARGARIASWTAGPQIERVGARIPVHHRSTGHVRYDPSDRHGGSGPRSAQDGRRQEHLRAYLGDLLERLQDAEAIELIGPGQLHARLATLVRERDRRRGIDRPVASMSAGPITDAQLLERLRLRLDLAAPRRVVGS